MNQFITKFLLVTFGIPLVFFALWLFFADRHIDASLRNVIDPSVYGIQHEFAGVAVQEKSLDRIRILTSTLELSRDIITFSFLSKDRSISYEGIRKRERVFWPLDLIYPIRDISGRKVARLTIWPAPELLFETVNWQLLIVTLILAVLLSMVLTLFYLYHVLFSPLNALEKLVSQMSLGAESNFMFFGKYGGVWQNIRVDLKKLNAKVLDINTTVQMLFSVSKALTSQVDTSQIFKVIMLIIQKKFPGAMCAVLLPNEGGGLKIVAKIGFSNAFRKTMQITPGNPITDAFTGAKTVNIENLDSVDEKAFEDFIAEGVNSQMNVPLMDENSGVLGVLSVSSKEENVFDVSLTETVLVVAKYLSIALCNVKLHDKVVERNRQLETELAITSSQLLQTNACLVSKARDVKALSDISVFAIDKFDIAQITKYAQEKIIELTSAEAAYFFVADKSYENFIAVKTGVGEASFQEASFNKNNLKIIERLAESKAPILLLSPEEIAEQCPEILKYGKVFSAAFFPSIHNGIITGFGIVLNKFALSVSESDIKLIESITFVYSGIIEKVKLCNEKHA
ncbi:MAG: GAF domain-containing protein [Elusimicrobia bacterium]|nr:GAF domain-containing protein [Elusimicrobiota bacterium]